MQTETKAKRKRPAKLKTEYRKNGDVVLICRGRVIARFKSTADIRIFIEGFREAESARASQAQG
jgi:hypothetical protein